MAARTDRPTNKLHKMNRRPTDEKRPDGASFNGQSSTSVRQRRHFWIIFFPAAPASFTAVKFDRISRKMIQFRVNRNFCVCVCVAVCDADDVAGNSKRLDGGPSTLSRFSLFFPLRFCTPTYANEPVRDCQPEKKKKKIEGHFFSRWNWIEFRANRPLKEGGGAERIEFPAGRSSEWAWLATICRPMDVEWPATNTENQKRERIKKPKQLIRRCEADDGRQEVAPPFACQQSDVSSAAGASPRFGRLTTRKKKEKKKKWTQFQQPARWQFGTFGCLLSSVLSCQPMNWVNDHHQRSHKPPPPHNEWEILISVSFHPQRPGDSYCVVSGGRGLAGGLVCKQFLCWEETAHGRLTLGRVAGSN